MTSKIYFVVLLGLLCAGCSPVHENEHNEEKIKIQFTSYSNEFELFAEADPFVVGDTSNVLSHISHLTSFKAIEEGVITLRLIINNIEVSQTLYKPTRKGIYSFNIQPNTVGSAQLIYEIKTADGEFKIIVPVITVFATKEEAYLAAKNQIISKTNTVVFTKEQSWKIEFATEKPKIQPFGQVIKTTALVQPAQDDEVIMSAKTSGVITFTGDELVNGKQLLAGNSVFTISANGLAENNSTVRYAEAKNNYEQAKKNYERISELAADKIVSEKEFLSAKYEYENAKVLFETFGKNFNSAGQIASCPFSGFVNQIFVKNGQFVEVGQAIISISQNKNLLLRADLQQRYASILSSITSATIRNTHDNQMYSLEELNGKILTFGKNANPDNYLIPINIRIDNKGTFIPGSFVEIFLKTMTHSHALTLPLSALLEEQGSYFVFVQVNPELFEKRQVEVGSNDGFRTEIKNGISENERIVTHGAVLVKLAQSAGALDAHSGHVH